jgi:hypothetical protein
MEKEEGQLGIFNDYPLYESLRQAQHCKGVTIVGVRIQHNGRFIQGLQVTYRSTFMDGSVTLTEGEEHFFRDGSSGYARGDTQTDHLILEPNEYMISIKPKQAVIVDGITFVTNRREVHYGGNCGNWINVAEAASLISPAVDVLDPSSYNSSGRIVAFAGTAKGVLQRIGFLYDSPDDHKIHFYFSGTSPNRHNTDWSRNHGEVIRQARTMLGLDSFDDYNFLQSIYPQLTGIDITKIAVYHNGEFCRGLEVTYRVSFANRNAIRIKGGRHILKTSEDLRGNRPDQRTDLVLIHREYLVGLRLYQQYDKIYGITFVTNFREFHGGGFTGTPTDCFPPADSPPSKVFALAGAFNSYLRCVGYYSSSLAWERSRPLVMARWQLKSGSYGNPVAYQNPEQMSIHRILTLPDGPFKRIIQYRAQIG